MADLFVRGGLQQDTGVLRERWEQDGVVRKEATRVFTQTLGTNLTVTSGKAFYCKMIVVTNELSGAANGVTIYDDSTEKITFSFPDMGTQSATFAVPIQFLTTVRSAASHAGSPVSMIVIGWEENV